MRLLFVYPVACKAILGGLGTPLPTGVPGEGPDASPDPGGNVFVMFAPGLNRSGA